MGKPGSPATVMASAPDGAGAHADHEPAAGGCSQRRLTLQEAVVAGKGPTATRGIPVGTVGEPATTRSFGVAGWTQPHDCRNEPGHRARSREVSCGPALDDPSWGGCALTALAFVLIIGEAERFQCGKQIASYLELVPLEDSSGHRRRLGHITKQGNSILRFLLVEAAQMAARSIPQWRSKYFHLTMRRGKKTAKVAMARRLAVRLYWMMRKEWDYQQVVKFGSHAEQPGHRHGVESNTE